MTNPESSAKKILADNHALDVYLINEAMAHTVDASIVDREVHTGYYFDRIDILMRGLRLSPSTALELQHASSIFDCEAKLMRPTQRHFESPEHDGKINAPDLHRYFECPELSDSKYEYERAIKLAHTRAFAPHAPTGKESDRLNAARTYHSNNRAEYYSFLRDIAAGRAMGLDAHDAIESARIRTL